MRGHILKGPTMKKLILTAALTLIPGLALAAPLASTDANANYGCAWVQGENTNALVLSKDCDGVPVITGGSKTSIEKRRDGEETVTDRVTRESRGGREEGRVEIARE
jgi:hypothetical protein